MQVPHRATIALPVFLFLAILSIIAIVTSVYSQRRRGNRIYLETYLLFAAWLVTIGMTGLNLKHALIGDLGRDGTNGPALFRADAPRRFSVQLLAATAIQLARVAVLFLFKRIFAANNFKQRFYAVFTLSWLYYVSVVVGFTIIYVLYPGEKEAPFNTKAYYVANNVMSCALDIATFCLPLSAIRTLHIDKRKKTGLFMVFGLGGFCIAAAIVRMVYYIKFSKITDIGHAGQVVFNINIWAVVEPFMSIVAACLPTCATLLKSSRHGGPSETKKLSIVEQTLKRRSLSISKESDSEES